MINYHSEITSIQHDVEVENSSQMNDDNNKNKNNHRITISSSSRNNNNDISNNRKWIYNNLQFAEINNNDNNNDNYDDTEKKKNNHHNNAEKSHISDVHFPPHEVQRQPSLSQEVISNRSSTNIRNHMLDNMLSPAMSSNVKSNSSHINNNNRHDMMTPYAHSTTATSIHTSTHSHEDIMNQPHKNKFKAEETLLPSSLPANIQYPSQILSPNAYTSWECPPLWLHQIRIELQRTLIEQQRRPIRPVTLKQCTDTIIHLYDTRKKILNSNLVEDTMEHHTYRNFEEKYGLRSLVLYHLSAFILGLKQYASRDISISIFQRIFRNDIDEYYYDMKYLKYEQRIRGYYIMQLQKRGYLLDTVDIEVAYAHIINSHVSYEDCKVMIEDVFMDVEEKNIMIEMLQKIFQNNKMKYDKKSNNNSNNNNNNNNHNTNNINHMIKFQKYSINNNKNKKIEISRLVLTVVIQNMYFHLLQFYQNKYLPWTECFRHYDTDADNVLTMDIFKTCFHNYYDEYFVKYIHQKIELNNNPSLDNCNISKKYDHYHRTETETETNNDNDEIENEKDLEFHTIFMYHLKQCNFHKYTSITYSQSILFIQKFLNGHILT